MRGKIIELNLFDPTKREYGLIEGLNGTKYYFNQASISGKTPISSFFVGDQVSFTVEKTSSNYDRALHILIEEKAPTASMPQYVPAGVSRRLNLSELAEEHLKPDSGELEAINKLAEILQITRIGHHYMDQASKYQFCLAGVTDTFKQFVHESGEFIIVFSHFDDASWQQKTLKVERELRKRRDLQERHPLANFYILISNAIELREKVDAVKGEPRASAIPFSFDEILSCKTKDEITNLVLSRFGEYYFENDMMGENDAIDDDNLLFGDRGQIADGVVARCEEGKHSGIFGLRRSGKSSVLNAVLRRLDWRGIPYIKVEARNYESYESWKDVLFDIACDVRARMLEIERQPGESRAAFVRRLKLGSTEDDYSRRAVRCFIDDIDNYCQDTETGKDWRRKFVIAIDEVELISYNTASSDVWTTKESCKSFWSAMRDCGCPLVLCGVNSSLNESSMLKFRGESVDNPMYGRITDSSTSPTTYLPTFTDEQTKIMINTLGGYSNLDFSDVYSQINAAFGGQPWSIRQFCSYVFKNVKDSRQLNRQYRVTRPMCEKLLKRFNQDAIGVEMCKTILQYLNDLYREEYSLLGRLALNPESKSSLSVDDIVLIDHLRKYGLIEYDADAEYMTFRIDIIRDYMCRTLTKKPEDMDNDERRRYIQDRIPICERKLKALIRDVYIGRKGVGEEAGLAVLRQYLDVDEYGKKRSTPAHCTPLRPKGGFDLYHCHLEDFFDHKKCEFHFSTVKKIITDSCWTLVSDKFRAADISKPHFITYMEQLNAGRTDADHYDAEQVGGTFDNWEIDEKTLNAFRTAFDAMEHFFEVNKL